MHCMHACVRFDCVCLHFTNHIYNFNTRSFLCFLYFCHGSLLWREHSWSLQGWREVFRLTTAMHMYTPGRYMGFVPWSILSTSMNDTSVLLSNIRGISNAHHATSVEWLRVYKVICLPYHHIHLNLHANVYESSQRLFIMQCNAHALSSHFQCNAHALNYHNYNYTQTHSCHELL